MFTYLPSRYALMHIISCFTCQFSSLSLYIALWFTVDFAPSLSLSYSRFYHTIFSLQISDGTFKKPNSVLVYLAQYYYYYLDKESNTICKTLSLRPQCTKNMQVKYAESCFTCSAAKILISCGSKSSTFLAIMDSVVCRRLSRGQATY